MPFWLGISPSPFDGLGGFGATTVPPSGEGRGSSALRLRFPYRVPRGEGARTVTGPSSSPRVPGPLQRQHCESTHAGLYLARYVPSSGFLSPSTACASQRLVALFRATSTRGVPTLQGFSPFRERCRVSTASALSTIPRADAHSRPQGLAPPEGSVGAGRLFRPSGTSMPSWVSSPPGCSLSSP
jgi:hypothetical protein